MLQNKTDLVSGDLNIVSKAIEESRVPLFISGPAGSGKSTLLEQFTKNNKNKNIVLLAPTGTAALIIKGQTIHKFFNFGIGVTPEAIARKPYSKKSRDLFKSLKIIIIDEVSMLRADLLDCIDVVLRKNGGNKNKAFGGVKMVFFGDLFQLPPVVTSEIAEMFKSKKYESEFFFSAEVFKDSSLEIVKLNKIYRQNDKKFISILSRVRNNNVASQDLNILNSRVVSQAKVEDNEIAVTLTTINKKADLINQESLMKLPSKIYFNSAIIKGDFGKELYPTDKDLQFKIGAQVMLITNNQENKWVNGSVGEIVNYNAGIASEAKVKIKLQNGEYVFVLPHKWEVFQFNLIGNNIKSKEVGTFIQFPFRLAWAITIHKSQGKTFDKANIDLGRGAFVSGQLYVALSRCRTIEGITLSKPIKHSDIIVNDHVKKFMDRTK